MIALPYELPLVDWKTKRQIPLSDGWLDESLTHAAESAGTSDWQWSRDIALAVNQYLKDEYPSSIISVPELETIVKKSLTAIGYPEVASHFNILPPRVSIYLPDIANEASFELLFFSLLKEKLEEANTLLVRGVKLEGLRSCVKILGRTRRWQTRCQRLSEEIVIYSRKFLHSHPETPKDLMIS